MSDYSNSVNAKTINYPQANSQRGGFVPGHHVVCPPKYFYKYSVFDEINPKINMFKEILSYNNEIATKNNKSYQKIKKFGSVFLKTALALTVCVIAYKNKSRLKNAVQDVFDTVKNLVKK